MHFGHDNGDEGDANPVALLPGLVQLATRVRQQGSSLPGGPEAGGDCRIVELIPEPIVPGYSLAMPLCLAILSPCQAQFMEWSPNLSLCRPQAGQGPSLA